MATRDAWPHDALEHVTLSASTRASLELEPEAWTWIASDGRDLWVGEGPMAVVVLALLDGVWRCL